MGKKREILYTKSQRGMRVTVENCHPPKRKVFLRNVLIFMVISLLYITRFGFQSYISKCVLLAQKTLVFVTSLLSMLINLLVSLKDLMGKSSSN